jgi:hypothetical protein
MIDLFTDYHAIAIFNNNKTTTLSLLLNKTLWIEVDCQRRTGGGRIQRDQHLRGFAQSSEHSPRNKVGEESDNTSHSIRVPFSSI